MSRKLRAAVLAVGTELTSGQTTNRNAAWISARLADLNVETRLHLTVPDDRELILAGLEQCAREAGLVFVTGGLGPTTDDFTREVIAQWCGQELRFDEPSWNAINERLGRMGVRVAESNRQQCWFPEHAVPLPNAQGTARGFWFRHAGTDLWALPGPPREIEAIWNDSIASQLEQIVPRSEPLRLLRWQCLGKSESELGEITERALAGSGVTTGYRAHRPYIEIKVWCPENRLAGARPFLAALERAIAPWLVCRDDEDLAAELLALLDQSGAEAIRVIDAFTGGELGKRLGTLAAQPSWRALWGRMHLSTLWNDPLESPQGIPVPASRSLRLTVEASGHSTWRARLEGPDSFAREEEFEFPYKKLENPEILARTRTAIAELAMKHWRDWLRAAK